MPFLVTFARRELPEMSVDGLPTPNAIIVCHILEKYVGIKCRYELQAVSRVTYRLRRFRKSVRLH
jgi:hypothetical protein